MIADLWHEFCRIIIFVSRLCVGELGVNGERLGKMNKIVVQKMLIVDR